MMQLPDDRLHLTLMALSNAARGWYTQDGRQFVLVQIERGEWAEWEILPEEIDRLESWGWIKLLPPRPEAPPDQAEVKVTDQGNYWLQKWLGKKTTQRREQYLLDQFRSGRRPDLGIDVRSVWESAA